MPKISKAVTGLTSNHDITGFNSRHGFSSNYKPCTQAHSRDGLILIAGTIIRSPWRKCLAHIQWWNIGIVYIDSPILSCAVCPGHDIKLSNFCLERG